MLEVDNETTTFMASTSSNVNKASKSDSGEGQKGLYEQWKHSYDEDQYHDNDFNHRCLTDLQMEFAKCFSY